MPTFYGAIDLVKNELRNAVVQNLGSAPASPNKGQLWMDSTNNILKWWDGSQWINAMSAAGAIPSDTVTTAAIGDTAVPGTATPYSRGDHKHAMPAFGNVSAETASFGSASGNGTGTTVARSDHTHGNPTHDAAAHSGILGTVTALSAFGVASSNGSAGTVSRSDHVHGSPAHDAAAHTSLLGNVTAQTTFGAASGNGSATTISRSDHVHGTPTHDATAHSAISLSSLAVPTAALSMNSQRITSLADPTAATDAATKQYTDNLVAGLSAKQPVRVATTANITLSGTQTIDGIAVVAGDRVLVKNQTTAGANGIYVVATGAWTRATDLNAWSQVPNAYVWVMVGTSQADTGWVSTADPGGTIGTTAMPWVQFNAGQAYTAGNGLTLTGNSFAVGQGTGITVGATTVAVDTTTIATVSALNTAVTGMVKKFAANLTGTASPETVTHNLNTRDVSVTVLNGASPYTAVEVDWDAATVNSVTIRYSPNLGAGYRVVVMG